MAPMLHSRLKTEGWAANNRDIKIPVTDKVQARSGRRCALTVAGSDSGGGAGLQADLRTFAALGVHGATVVTCVTAQHPGRVIGVDRIRPAMVRRQLEAVFEGAPPAACKTGMLYDASVIREVAAFVRSLGRQGPSWVVDPVMVASSGKPLLKPGALNQLTGDLFPCATLVTPNVPEAEVLSGLRIRDPEHQRKAAREIHGRYGCAVLVKGGHLKGMKEAVDLLYDGETEWMLSAPMARGVAVHGTGCTYAAAITAQLARGRGLAEAVRRAKDYISRAILGRARVGRHWVLGWDRAVSARPSRG